MNYCGYYGTSIVDGEGLRVSIFISGCRRHCNECFNPDTWDFNYGSEFDEAAMETLIKQVSAKHVDGLSILGGEPFEPENISGVHAICKAVRRIPTKTIWMYTGYTIEELEARNDPTVDDILALTDVLVDGPFIAELKDIKAKFRGSTNQRVIDMHRTRLAGRIMLWEDNGGLL